ncbi:hypothetical protein JXD20_00660 [Candidatus Peregrinibacteria bacterium]|nr:hypothetical protein [Candidatus Peregrinibacteria bacterium]
MANTKKVAVKKTAAGTQEGVKKAAKTVDDVFGKLKKHFEPVKVDAWQKKWLEVPANRKKYEKLSDAPEVVGEELTAIVNDIIDFAQGEETGKSGFLKKMKGIFGKAAETAKKGATLAVGQAKKGAEMAAEQAKKSTDMAKSATDKVTKTAAKTAKKAKK